MNNFSNSADVNFRFTFPMLPFMNYEKGTDVLLYCKNVNLPGVAGEITNIGTPFIPIKDVSNILTYEDLSLSFAIDELFKNYKYLYNWRLALKNPEEFGFKTKREKVNGTLHILTNNKNPIIDIVFHNLLPVSIGNIDFAHTSSTSDDLMVNASFAFDYFTIEE